MSIFGLESVMARKKDAPKVYRQGDVLVRQVAVKKQAEWKPVLDNGRCILAYGEVTGHAHEVVAAVKTDDLPKDMPPAQLFEAPDGKRFLMVAVDCTLIHQEHGPIALKPGAYEVVRQREYTDDDERRERWVAD